MQVKNMICIQCPRGCNLVVTIDNEISVSGNFCVKGKEFAEIEAVCPKRVVTSSVRLTSGEMLPIRTDRAVEKAKIFYVMNAINALHPSTPIKSGDTILKNVDGEGSNIIACTHKE